MKRMRMLLLMASFMILLPTMNGCQQRDTSADSGTSASTSASTSTSIKDNNNELFDLKIYSDKQVYKTRDEIKIWATLEYTEDKGEIKIWHGEPYIIYCITNGKDFNLDGIRETILKSTVLKKGELNRYDYIKSGGYSNDDPNADFWKKFFEEKELYLPEGEYTIKAYCDFSLTESVIDSKYNQYSELTIKVEK